MQVRFLLRLPTLNQKEMLRSLLILLALVFVSCEVTLTPDDRVNQLAYKCPLYKNTWEVFEDGVSTGVAWEFVYENIDSQYYGVSHGSIYEHHLVDSKWKRNSDFFHRFTWRGGQFAINNVQYYDLKRVSDNEYKYTDHHRGVKMRLVKI